MFRQFSHALRAHTSIKALLPMLGAAVPACELEGLPWSTAHLAKLEIHATGKGNAKKPQVQAAAKTRDLGEMKPMPRGPAPMCWIATCSTS